MLGREPHAMERLQLLTVVASGQTRQDVRHVRHVLARGLPRDLHRAPRAASSARSLRPSVAKAHIVLVTAHTEWPEKRPERVWEPWPAVELGIAGPGARRGEVVAARCSLGWAGGHGSPATC